MTSCIRRCAIGLPLNVKVSDGSQPPMTLDLSLSESAGSRSLHRLVRLSPCYQQEHQAARLSSLQRNPTANHTLQQHSSLSASIYRPGGTAVSATCVQRPSETPSSPQELPDDPARTFQTPFLPAEDSHSAEW